MLRDFVYTLDPELIGQMLRRFDVTVPEEKHKLALVEFKVLTPDSFVWRFLIDEAVYYLYAEDYVQGLEDVRSKISSYAVKDAKFDFVKARQPKEFEDTTPVKNAVVYRPPKNYDEMKQFAVDSGHDFVFLCKSSENASDALFNE